MMPLYIQRFSKKIHAHLNYSLVQINKNFDFDKNESFVYDRD